MDLCVRVLEGAAADAFMASSWAELYRQDPEATPYQSPSWLTGWAQQLPATARPVAVLCEDAAGRVLAALPLVHDLEHSGARTYALSAPMGEYVRAVGPAAEDPRVSASFARYLHHLVYQGHQVEIAGLPIGGHLAQQLAPRGPAPVGLWCTSVTDCAEIALPLAYELMSRSTRREHKRRRRAWDELAASRKVTYRRTRDSVELLDAYAVLARLHAHRWAGRTPPAGVRHTPDATHWQAVLNRCGPGTAFIATLALDGEVVAAQLCLTRNRRAYSVVPAMHPNYKDLAPGHALLRHLAQDLTCAGYEHLDLGRTVPGQHAYKNQYRPRWSETLCAVSTPAPEPRRVPDELPTPQPQRA
jgi:CelD/BcsL family acetyltransferase involved in cellulose biosynthesis